MANELTLKRLVDWHNRIQGIAVGLERINSVDPNAMALFHVRAEMREELDRLRAAQPTPTSESSYVETLGEQVKVTRLVIPTRESHAAQPPSHPDAGGARDLTKPLRGLADWLEVDHPHVLCNRWEAAKKLRALLPALKEQIAAMQAHYDALREQVRQLARLAHLRRNVLIFNNPEFRGEWIAIPREDFDRLRAALAATATGGNDE